MTQNQNTQALRLSFEYFPPNTDTANERLWRAISRHAVFAPEFVSITYGAGGTTRERTQKTLARVKKKTQLDAAGHLTTVGGSRQDVLGVAQSYRDLGVKHIVALRGDKPKDAAHFQPQADGFQSSLELISALKDEGFEVSVGAYPEKHPDAADQSADLAFLKRKFEAGADRAITQFFFEKDKFLRFRDAAQKAGINKPILPGILPVENFDKMKGFAEACGTSVPAWLGDAFANAQTEEAKYLLSVSVACDMIENLRAEGVEHFHIYTLNNPELTFDICTALGVAKQIDIAELVA